MRTPSTAYSVVLAAALTAAAAQTRRAATLERRRAAAHAAGYRQGLTHAALGLLNPTPSTRVDDPSDNERTPQ